MIALPLTLLALATALSFVRHGGSLHASSRAGMWRIPRAELITIVLMGFVAGALRATNTWDYPTYLLVPLVALGIVGALRTRALPSGSALDERLILWFRSLISVGWRAMIVVAVSSLAFYPFTKYYATAYAGLQLWKGARTTIPDFLTVHGFFLALTVLFLAIELWDQWRRDALPDWLAGALLPIAVVLLALLVAGLALGVQVWVIALPLLALAVAPGAGARTAARPSFRAAHACPGARHRHGR